MTADKLPKGWIRVKFGDVARKVNDRVDPDTAGIKRYVAGEHMDTDDLTIRRWGEVGDGYLGPAFHMRFKPGQVLYGSRRTYLRKVAVADFEGITANTTFVIEPSSKDLLPEFLPLVMTTEAFHEHSIKQSKGSVNPYINFSDLTWYEFALPPIDEQGRIAELLHTADGLVDRYARAAAARADLLDALLASAAADTDALTLEEVCGEPITYGIVQAGPEYDGGVPYVRVSDMTAAESLTDVTLPRTSPVIAARYGRSACRPGDLIFALRGPIGLTRVVPESLDGVNLTQGTARLSPDTAKVAVDYLQWALRSRDVETQFRSLRKGSTFQELSLAAVRKIRLRIPDLDTQQAIVETLSAADSVGTCSQSSRTAAASLARSIREVSLRGGA